MRIHEIKFLIISADIIIIIFLLSFFNIEWHGAVSDTSQNIEYEIKFKIPDRWKYLPDYDIDTNNDISTTSFVLTQNDSIIKTKGKTLYGYLIMIRILLMIFHFLCHPNNGLRLKLLIFLNNQINTY